MGNKSIDNVSGLLNLIDKINFAAHKIACYYNIQQYEYSRKIDYNGIDIYLTTIHYPNLLKKTTTEYNDMPMQKINQICIANYPMYAEMMEIKTELLCGREIKVELLYGINNHLRRIQEYREALRKTKEFYRRTN